MKQMGFAAVLALGLSVTALPAAPQAAGGGEKDVTITGCVVKGDGGYVLTDVLEGTTATAMAARIPSTPQPEGTVLPARVLYWLDDDDDVKDYAGQKIEIRGERKGDIEKGKISAEREGGLVELEFKVDGDKKVTIKVPEVPAAIGTSGAVGDKEKDFNYVVRRIDVDSVKMISSTCR